MKNFIIFKAPNNQYNILENKIDYEYWCYLPNIKYAFSLTGKIESFYVNKNIEFLILIVYEKNNINEEYISLIKNRKELPKEVNIYINEQIKLYNNLKYINK